MTAPMAPAPRTRVVNAQPPGRDCSRRQRSVNFTVTNVARATFVYRPADNHDRDSDSTGTIVYGNEEVGGLRRA